MSVTTTTNARVITLRETLAEYELHHSETNANPATGSPAPDPNPQPLTTHNNPSWWDTAHRRVPPYRPVQPDRLNPERNTYTSNVEQAFVWVMLNGVGLQATVSRVWRATGEKVTGPSWFQHRIGGEW